MYPSQCLNIFKHGHAINDNILNDVVYLLLQTLLTTERRVVLRIIFLLNLPLVKFSAVFSCVPTGRDGLDVI